MGGERTRRFEEIGSLCTSLLYIGRKAGNHDTDFKRKDPTTCSQTSDIRGVI